MTNPGSVFVGRPIYDRCTPQHDRGMLELVGQGLLDAQYDHVSQSSISDARDYVVHYFLTRTTCDWLVWIDSDISFTLNDWAYLMEQQEDELAVCAEYMKKTQDLSIQVAQFGLGFARVHRSVYEQLDALTHEDGEPRLRRYRSRVETPGEPLRIEEFVEYHPVGVAPDGSRKAEDHFFWLLVGLAQIRIRIETRTRLGHTGTFTWWYDKARLDALRAEQLATST